MGINSLPQVDIWGTVFFFVFFFLPLHVGFICQPWKLLLGHRRSFVLKVLNKYYQAAPSLKAPRFAVFEKRSRLCFSPRTGVSRVEGVEWSVILNNQRNRMCHQTWWNSVTHRWTFSSLRCLNVNFPHSNMIRIYVQMHVAAVGTKSHVYFLSFISSVPPTCSPEEWELTSNFF